MKLRYKTLHHRTLLKAFVISTFALFSPQIVTAQSTSNAVKEARFLSRAFATVAKKVTPSLVNIKATTKVKKISRQDLPPDLPAPFRDFFEQFGHHMPKGQRRAPGGGLGSGVIIDSKGHILTNNHVIEGADEVMVRLHDERTYEAQIIGSDPRTDLAVIKIDAENITAAKIGNSDDLEIGEWVVAAGAPFGLDNTITAGIVSAKGRSIMGGNAYEDFIQTDAAINPGNSGGPLANLNGEVIGINTAIFSRSGGYMGIGFAIPMNLARDITDSLIEDGKVVRGWLGVIIQELTEELASTFDYPSTKGALVSQVAEDSPAEKGGIKEGDIIVSLNEKPIEDVNELRNFVAAEAPESYVSLKVIREGRAKTLKVKLGELPANGEAQSVEEEEEDDTFNEIGARLKNLTRQSRKKLNAKTSHGIVVEAVEPDGIAAKAKLRPGDIIHTVGSEEIHSIGDFEEAIEDGSLKKGIRVIAETRGMNRFLVLKSE